MNRNGGIGTEGIYQNSFPASSKNHSIILFIITLALSTTERGEASQGENRGTRPVCLGGSFSAVAGDAWSVYHNPAGLALVEEFQSSAFFIPQQFGLSELKTVSFVAALPFSSVGLGIGAEHFGFTLYKETGISVGFGMSIGGGVFGGIAAHIDRIEIERYGSAEILTVNAGLGARLSEEWTMGFFGRNLNGARIGLTNQRLPRIISLGAGYEPFDDLLLTLEVEKDTRYSAMINAGIEQWILGCLALRCGFSTHPDLFAAGVELRYSDFAFGYAATRHPDLGWTQHIELRFQVKP